MTLFNVRSQFATGGATYNPFENPAVPLSSVALDGVFGTGVSSDSGENVGPDRALTIPTFFRCISLISGIIAGCPLLVFKNPGKKSITVPALDPANGDTLYTQFELWELVMVHLLMWGNAYVLKVRDGLSRVTDLQPIHPSRVTPVPIPGGKKFLVKPLDANGQTSGTPVPYSSDQIMHIPALGYDGIAGLSVVDYARQAVGTALAGDRLAAKFYSQGTQLSGILKTAIPLSSQNQADELKRRWRMKNSGINNAADVAILDAETDFQPLTIPPDQLQFLDARRWQTTEIARMFGIPPHLVGDVEKSTSWGSGIEQQNTAFVAYTLGQWANRIEQRVTREVVQTRGQSASFDFSSLLRGDMTERFTAYAAAIQWGFMTRNEARLREDWEPIEGLDQPLTPLNMIAGKVKIDPMTGEPTPTPQADLDGPLTSTVKPGSGKSQALDESNE